ncbi:UNVERIFIED_ORG: hypothetical protein [Escherichia phage CMSTMSU]
MVNCYSVYEKKIDDVFFSPKDKFEPSDYKVIIRDDSIYISSDHSNYLNQYTLKMLTTTMNY